MTNKTWNEIRNEFPVLTRKIDGREIVYLDSACMALKPEPVIDTMNEYYERFPACGGRSVHKLAEEVSNAFSQARADFASFIGASRPEECIWTRNATESINMVARSLPIPHDSKIVTTSLEHHSGSLPFVERGKRDNLEVEVVKPNNEGIFDIEDWKRAIDSRTKIVSIVHSSNVTGTIAPIKKIVEIAHDYGALVLSDDAQYAPHHPLDVGKNGVDFSAISVHKMCGPTGMGVLYGRYELLEEMNMFLHGGDTVHDVRFENGKIKPEYLPPPEKFEAGLQNYAGAIGAAAAANYLDSIGMDRIEKHERALLGILLSELGSIENVRIVGPKSVDKRTGLVTFSINTVGSAHDVATYLSSERNVFIRSGAHCANPFHYQIGIPPEKGTNRASVYLYNNQEDVNTLLNGITDFIEITS
jgi:cysteine desulfurase / selenocysteine lyase